MCNLSNTRSDLGLSAKGSALLTSDKYDSQLLVMEIRRHKRVRVASRLLSETAGSSAECAGRGRDARFTGTENGQRWERGDPQGHVSCFLPPLD